MSLVLCIHTTYTSVEVALARDNKILGSSSITKEQASAQLVPTINAILNDNHLQLSDISHIIVNQGPAPFTTLRTIIATANGIAFAHKIPMVGIDALEVLMPAYYDTHSGPTVVLLNAFNKAVYYCMSDPSDKHNLKGYAPIAPCIAKIQTLFKDCPIHFIGNGAQLYRSEIESALGVNARFQDPLLLTASLQQILDKGIEQLHANEGITQFIKPLYLKKPLT